MRTSFEVTNAADLVIATFDAPDLAFAWVEREGDRRGALKVERVVRTTSRQIIHPNVIALSERRKRRAS